MYKITDYLQELGWSAIYDEKAGSSVAKPMGGVWNFNDQRMFLKQMGDTISGYVETPGVANVTGVVREGQLDISIFWVNGQNHMMTSKRRIGHLNNPYNTRCY